MTPCNLIRLTICVSDVVVLICVILNYVTTVCINTEDKQNIPKLSVSDVVVLICVILRYVTTSCINIEAKQNIPKLSQTIL